MNRQGLFVGLLFFLLVVLLGLKARKEGFFGSPGTYVQLATSHVPDENDLWEAENYRKVVNRDLIDLTGSGL